MESCDKRLILANMDQLVMNTTYEELINECQERKLLSSLMVTNIEEDVGNDLNSRHKQLFNKLTQRGPRAFDIILDICKDLGYDAAHAILKPNVYPGNWKDLHKKYKENHNENWPGSSGTGAAAAAVPVITVTRPSTTEAPIELHEYLNEVPRKHEMKRATGIKMHCKEKIPLETYSMQSECRGILFLVNIIDMLDKDRHRKGASFDKENLIDLFRQMNFKIFYYENLYREQFDLLVSQLAKSSHLRKPDCLVFALLTHGIMSGNSAYAEFTDGGFVKVEDIMQSFNNKNCTYLVGKPKIFLFPFCRGDKPDRELNVTVIEKREVQYDGYVSVSRRYPSFSDILICYATVPGYETHRDPDFGSWYIQKFCAVLAEYSHSSSFEEMLKIIHQKVGEMKTTSTNIQTPCFESRGFNKVLYFNPGYTRS